jgi:hypothetical protein
LSLFPSTSASRRPEAGRGSPRQRAVGTGNGHRLYPGRPLHQRGRLENFSYPFLLRPTRLDAQLGANFTAVRLSLRWGKVGPRTDELALPTSERGTPRAASRYRRPFFPRCVVFGAGSLPASTGHVPSPFNRHLSAAQGGRRSYFAILDRRPRPNSAGIYPADAGRSRRV